MIDWLRRSAELSGAIRVGDQICTVNDVVVGSLGGLKHGMSEVWNPKPETRNPKYET